MRQYWVELIIGKLYAVNWHDGNYTVTAYEGTEAECEKWIEDVIGEKQGYG